MVFLPPSWLPDVTSQIPPTANVYEFVLAGRRASGSTRPPLVCGVTSKSYTADEVHDKVETLAKALCQDLAWSPNQGLSQDKVVGILSGNSLDFLVACWAVHRIGGTCLLLQPTTSASEIVSHMTKARCEVFFSSEELLPLSENVFDSIAVVPRKVYCMNGSVPHAPIRNYTADIKSLPQLLEEGRHSPEIEPLQPRDSFTEIAYLLTTSGTSGLQRLAKITHANMIANIIQPAVFESSAKADWPRVGLGVLPQNHGYGLVTTHAMFCRGDTTVVHPSFNMQLVLKSVQEHRIERLYLVPPVVAALAANPILFKLYDVSSVKDIVLGAAACSETVTQKMRELQPRWDILVGYGLTECVSIVSWSRAADILPGSSGLLLPSNQARLISAEGEEITAHDVAGELYLRSPALIPGYLGEDESVAAKFVIDGWLPTGDVGFFRLSPKGDSHLYLVDRLKDMIKVKGFQVNPGEIEEVLRRQPGVAEASVIGIKDDITGERPLAFVVAANVDMTASAREELIVALDQSVKNGLDETHWLRKQIYFIQEMPRSQSGKVLKKALRAKVQQECLGPTSCRHGTATPAGPLVDMPKTLNHSAAMTQLVLTPNRGGWIVQKFGGTGIGRFLEKIAEDIIRASLGRNKIAVICSAMNVGKNANDTTTRLYEVYSKLQSISAAVGDSATQCKIVKEATIIMQDVCNDHLCAVQASTVSPYLRDALCNDIENDCQELIDYIEATRRFNLEVSSRSKSRVVSLGEKLSARFMTFLLRDRNVQAEYVDLTDAVRLNNSGDQTDTSSLYQGLLSMLRKRILACGDRVPVFTSFGVFGDRPTGRLIDISLGKGCTDLCAALVAICLQAEELQIWTDVDGFFTADPTIVPTARLLAFVTPMEAAELTVYGGSEVVYHFAIEQAMKATPAIPVRIKNIKFPWREGTVICPDSISKLNHQHNSRQLVGPDMTNMTLHTTSKRPTAVTIRDNITIISVDSNKRSVAYSFLSTVFSILDGNQISVDLISTSHMQISMAIHLNANDTATFGAVRQGLEHCGDISVLHNMAILSLVGADMKNMIGISGKMFSVLGEHNINIEMISQGASEINISCVVDARDAARAINILHTNLFAFLE